MDGEHRMTRGFNPRVTWSSKDPYKENRDTQRLSTPRSDKDTHITRSTLPLSHKPPPTKRDKRMKEMKGRLNPMKRKTSPRPGTYLENT